MARILSQALITRLPYAEKHDPKPIIEASKKVDLRGLICLSIPIHIENPNGDGDLIAELQKAGLFLVAKIVWFRDRHIVTTRSKRLTNTYETLAIFSRSKSWIINRDAASKLKRGFENREANFDDEEYQCCIGDHWAVRNDRRDRRYLPDGIILNCAQLADLQPKDTVLDLYGIPTIEEACKTYGWTYRDLGLTSPLRAKRTQSSEGPV